MGSGDDKNAPGPLEFLFVLFINPGIYISEKFNLYTIDILMII